MSTSAESVLRRRSARVYNQQRGIRQLKKLQRLGSALPMNGDADLSIAATRTWIFMVRLFMKGMNLNFLTVTICVFLQIRAVWLAMLSTVIAC